MKLLSRGNTKLGSAVVSFDVPSKQTCPGATKTCLSTCYASRGRFRTGTVAKKMQANLKFAKGRDFDKLIYAEIVTSGAKLVRCHVSGDLFDADYARSWLRVFRALPDVTFWLYTRSWRKPEIRRVIVRMAALSNVHVWFSVDKDSGVPNSLPKGVRTAWLMTRTEDAPTVPVDLVFRSRNLKKTVAETVNGSPVCPTETGLSGAKSVTCGRCQKCFTDPNSRPVAGRIPLSVVS